MVRYIGLPGLACVAGRLSVHLCPNNAVITGQSCCIMHVQLDQMHVGSNVNFIHEPYCAL